MSKTYLPYEPDQQLLLPAALQEWLPDDHLAYFISDVVDQLDMSKVTARYERERRGGPPYLSPRDRMRRKLQTRRGRQRYALRMQTVETVFGQIKQGRGFRQFLLRGLEKVNGEWSLICTGHNLLKLFRFGVNLHRKARVVGLAQRIRNFAEVVEHGAIRKAIWGPAGATGKISCRDPLSLTRKHR